jgi:hypothetical protein
MRCERKIVGENFEKKKRKQVRKKRETIKKYGKKIFERDSGRKKDVGRKFKKIAL